MYRKVLLVVVAVPLLAACGSTPTKSAVAPSTSSVPSSTTAPSSTTTSPVPSIAPYLAMWPFRTWADVVAWQESYEANGSGEWHLSPGSTALEFTQDYLGFSDVDVVVSTTTNASGAHVAVGFRPTSNVTSTSAVVHLVRWGTGQRSPWEVVGTDDTTFSMTKPSYGAVAESPVATGGVITGVDESIEVAVRQPSSSTPLGSFCCVPAGGNESPWSAEVSFAGAIGPVLTVVAVTGGHVQRVERFTVTAIRTSP